MFVWIGVIGALLLVFSLVFGDVLDGLIEGLVPENEWLSLTAIATFMAAFGLFGYLVDSRIGAPIIVSITTATAAGVGLGSVGVRWSRSLSDMRTDATPTASDLVGCEGRVVTTILPNSTGEVLIRLGGQPVKLTAVNRTENAGPLNRETNVVVVGVLSPTRVEVQAAESFWN